MYDGVSTSVRIHDEYTYDFPITKGLYQGSTLNPYLFTLVLNALMKHIQKLAPRCMLFTYDVVMFGVSREELNGRLDTLIQAFEVYNFRLGRSKTGYMECNFNKRISSSTMEVKVGGHKILQITWFKYLVSIVQNDA